MLRVWGGGVYQSDHFYNEADRLGIMVHLIIYFYLVQYFKI